MLARAVAHELRKVLGVELSIPSEEINLKHSEVLQIKMIEAAARYSVDSHVIEPRVRQELE